MRVILFLLVLMIPGHPALSQNVSLHPDPDQELAMKWSWALRQTPASTSDFWIGYSIERLMGESEYLGSNLRFHGGTMSGSFHGDFPRREFIGTPLVELLGRKTVVQPDPDLTDDERVSKAAKERLRTLDDQQRSEKKVMKEIAILYHVQLKGGQGSVRSVQYGNVVLPFELSGFPLIWLGKTNPAQSLPQITGIYERSQGKDLKRSLIRAAGLHPLPDQVVRFAGGIIRDKTVEKDLRKAAVYAMEYQQDPAAVKLLQETIQSDFDEEIRKAAIFALADQGDPGASSFLKALAIREPNNSVAKAACYAIADVPGAAAFDALASILRDARNPEVRKAALFAIADQGEKPAQELLMDVAIGNHSGELAKAAVYALADLLEAGGGKVLLDVQQNAALYEVKKAAIYEIADLDGPETVELLGKILSKEPDPELRKAVVYALSDVESEKAIDLLLHVVVSESDREIRKAAIYALGDMDSPRARTALIDVLNESAVK